MAALNALLLLALAAQVAAYVPSASLSRNVRLAGASRTQTFPRNAAVRMVAEAEAPSETSTPRKGSTLTQYLIDEAIRNPDMQDVERLMGSISTACKRIASLVNKAEIAGVTGLEEGGGSINVQGEEQKKLDVISNDVLKDALRFTGKMGVIASEEEDEPVLVDEFYTGDYVAVFDPLDGSSNIDAAISTGTIFGIFKTASECFIEDDNGVMSGSQENCLVNTLQPGSNLVASGYCMYSSSVMLVFTTGAGVNGFTLDSDVGEFILTHPDMKIPSRGKIYSMNEANYFDWDDGLRSYVDAMKKGEGQSGTKYSARYIGSMVGDIHRTLLYGGIFGYPGDAKNPNGKLRLLYEGAPMSYVLEQAGGKSTTGKERVMDVTPDGVHQRLPVFLGSPEDIDELMTYLN